MPTPPRIRGFPSPFGVGKTFLPPPPPIIQSSKPPSSFSPFHTSLFCRTLFTLRSFFSIPFLQNSLLCPLFFFLYGLGPAFPSHGAFTGYTPFPPQPLRSFLLQRFVSPQRHVPAQPSKLSLSGRFAFFHPTLYLWLREFHTLTSPFHGPLVFFGIFRSIFGHHWSHGTGGFDFFLGKIIYGGFFGPNFFCGYPAPLLGFGLTRQNLTLLTACHDIGGRQLNLLYPRSTFLGFRVGILSGGVFSKPRYTSPFFSYSLCLR